MVMALDELEILFYRAFMTLLGENPEEAKATFGERPFELKDVLRTFVRGRDETGKYAYNIIPTDTLYVTIDKEAVKKSGMMMATEEM